jgi:hypothetical protein
MSDSTVDNFASRAALYFVFAAFCGSIVMGLLVNLVH